MDSYTRANRTPGQQQDDAHVPLSVNNNNNGELNPNSPLLRNTNDKYSQVMANTLLWAQRNKYQPSPEDEEARIKTSQELTSKWSRAFYSNVFLAWLFTARFRSGPGQYYSPIGASFVKFVQTIRFGNPPSSALYRFGVWGLAMYMFSKQNQRVSKDTFFKYYTSLHTPLGAELRQQLRQVDPSSPYLQGIDVGEYDNSLKEREMFDSGSVSSSSSPSSSSSSTLHDSS